MRKNRKNILLTLLLVLAMAGTGVYIFFFILRNDTTPPEIYITDEMLKVPASYTESDLLQGVKAYDRTDGDVTAGLVVEQVTNVAADHKAEIVYAAFDRAGNVAKARRTVLLTDYRPPRIKQNAALAFPKGMRVDVLKLVCAEDILDGDISSYIKGNMVSKGDLGQTGLHQVEFRVTNSLGDTAKLTLPVEVYDAGTYNAAVELKDYLVYIRKGEEFRAEDYLEKLITGKRSYSLTEPDSDVYIVINDSNVPIPETAQHIIRIDMLSSVNNAAAGIYSVAYTVNLDDNYIGYTRLNVVVEE